jgi:hypothetical protein
MNLRDFLSGKGKLQKGKTTQWLPFCTLPVTTGALWAGDPNLANAEDGCVAKVPCGEYRIEGVGILLGRRRVVSSLRVRLQTAAAPKVGKEIGTTGTDSAMIGVCDIRAFDAAVRFVGEDAFQEALHTQIENGLGIIKIKRQPGAVMPCVPTGSDGTGPVFALMSAGRRAGIQLTFREENDAHAEHDAREISLLGEDRDDFKTWTLAGGGEVSCWVGGELKAGAEIGVWSSAQSGPVAYRIRRINGRLLKGWTPMKKTRGGGAPFGAVEVLGAGRFEIDFRIGKEIFSAIKLTLK